MTVVADVTNRLDALRSRYRVPGLVVGSLLGGTATYWGLGRCRVGGQATPDENTVFRIGSITKTFTAEAVTRLSRSGRLSLDDELASWLPLNASRWSGVTLRAVLDHRSGLPSEGPTEHWMTGRFPGSAELVATLADLKPVAAPGTVFKYSNYGYALLGLAVGRASGQPFERFVTQDILSPLWMSSTTWDGQPDRPSATGYVYSDTGHGLVQVEDAHQAALAPAGQLHSTAADQLRWAQHQLDRFVNEGPPQELSSLGPVRGGWFVSRSGGRLVVSHGGAVPGFQSALLLDPEAAWAGVALSNTLGHPVCDQAVDLLHSALRLRNSPDVIGGAAPAPEPIGVTLAWQGMRGLLSGDRYGYAFGFPYIEGLPAPAADRLMPSEDPDVFTSSSGRFLGERFRVVLDESGQVNSLVAPGGAVFQRARRP